jgi:hypothetical protein
MEHGFSQENPNPGSYRYRVLFCENNTPETVHDIIQVGLYPENDLPEAG